MIIEFLKRLYEPIRKGDEYRVAKYGNMYGTPGKFTDTSQPSNFFRSKKDIKKTKEFKQRYEFWDEWSGSMFVRRKNTNYKDDQTSRPRGSVCRTNPANGKWEHYI